MRKIDKAIVFWLTFFAQASLHSMWQGWSYSKYQIKEQFNLQQTQLGLVDTLYLISYSLGFLTLGNLSSKFSPRIFLGIGLMIACIFYLFFPVCYILSHSFSYAVLIIALCLNGLFQSTGWPAIMGLMGNMFGKNQRGLLMGFWSINSNFGNIIGLVVCNIIRQKMGWPWTANFFFIAGFTFIIALLSLILIKDKIDLQQQTLVQNSNSQKSEINQSFQEQDKITTVLIQNQQSQQELQQQKPKNINVFTALCLPRVPLYIIGYSLMKGCVHGLLFWLPTYLENKDLGQQKGYIASMFDVGAFIGGLIVGYLGDKYQKRALFTSPLLLLGGLLMSLIAFTFTSIAWMYYCGVFVVGLLIGGPYNIIGSAIALDLGEQAGKQNIGKVSALIEGCGAFYSALSQTIVSFLSFDSIFYLFSLQCGLAALVILPLFIKDLKKILKKNISQNQK